MTIVFHEVSYNFISKRQNGCKLCINMLLMIIYLHLFLGKTKSYAFNQIPSAENLYEKHVSNQPGRVLYYMWMRPSKVMPYLLRLATPLMDSSIVHKTSPLFSPSCDGWMHFWSHQLYHWNTKEEDRKTKGWIQTKWQTKLHTTGTTH